MVRRLPVLILLALLLPVVPSVAADYFGRPEEAPGPASSSRPGPETLPVPPAPVAALPEPLRAVLGGLAAMQSSLNAELRTHLRAARDGRSIRPAAAIVLFSFLYGVFHAIGPGHGKLVIGGYFLSRRARLLQGLSMSLSAALVQALSAILLVGAMDALFDLGTRAILDRAALLEGVSYAGITALGLWMGFGVISGRVCCDHDHTSGHDHPHHHDHDDGGDCGHHACAHQADRRSRRTEWRHVLLTGATVGLRPCSGAILVLLFTLANGIFSVGVVATLAMALGVAITVAAVSLGALGLNRWLARLGPADHAAAGRIRKIAALTGAFLIATFGLLQLLGIWLGLIVPMAG
ncbi:nickel/cobalt transporter [Telmatospirillum siberiense]|nr:ABC transporter [Telmatospirillum siberiense]